MSGPSDDSLSSDGADVPSVLGTAFSAVQSFVRDERRVINEMLRRVPSAKGTFGDDRGPYRNGTPLVITTESMAADGRYIVFWSGPSNTQWSFPMRGAEQQTRSGTIYHSWRNGSRDSFFDEPSVSFTFQAGNIMPVRIRGTEAVRSDGKVLEAISLPGGLLDFYEFFELLNQPKILSDGRPNFVFIAYHSLVYPEIFLRGFFTPEGLSFTDDSQNPAGLTWTSTFKVRSTEPPFWDAVQLVSSWRSAFSSLADLPTAAGAINAGPVSDTGTSVGGTGAGAGAAVPGQGT